MPLEGLPTNTRHGSLPRFQEGRHGNGPAIIALHRHMTFNPMTFNPMTLPSALAEQFRLADARLLAQNGCFLLRCSPAPVHVCCRRAAGTNRIIATAKLDLMFWGGTPNIAVGCNQPFVGAPLAISLSY
jgi:hypothetical protein